MSTFVEVVECTTDWTAQSVTNTPGSAGNILASKWRDVRGDNWCITAGCVIDPGISGSMSGYVNGASLTINNANGSSVHKVNAAGTINVTGGAITGITWTNLGRDYASISTFTAPTGTGVSFTTHTSGNTLQHRTSAGSGTPINTFGADGQLVRSDAGVAALDQFCHVEFWWSASTDKVAPGLRYNEATQQVYATSLRVSGGLGNVLIYAFTAYTGTTGATNLVNDTFSLSLLVPGHQYRLKTYAQGSNPTTLWAVLYDITAAATVWSTTPVTDSTAGLQAANGGPVLGIYGTGAPITKLIAGNGASVNPSITSVNLNRTGVTARLTTAGFTVTPSSVVSLSGGASHLNSATYVDANNFDVNFDVGATATTLTFTVDGYTGSLPALAGTMGAATAGHATSAGVTISGPAAAHLNGPIQYDLVAFQTPGEAYGDSGTTVVHTEAGVSEGVAPTPFLFAPTAGMWCLRWSVKDTNNQRVAGAQVSVVVPQAFSGKYILLEGTSITEGATGGTTLNRRAVNPRVTAAGTGYNPATVTAATTGGTAVRPAVFAVHLNGTALDYISVVDPGEYSTAFTGIAIDGHGEGSGGTATCECGGGAPLALELMLRSCWDTREFICINAGTNGSTSGSTATGTEPAKRAEAMAGSPSDTALIVMEYGVNDAATGVLVADFKTNMLAKVDRWVYLGYRNILLLKPIYWPGGTEAQLATLLQMSDALDDIAAMRAGIVSVEGDGLYDIFLANSTWLYPSDTTHPGTTGQCVRAASIAAKIASILRVPGSARTSVMSSASRRSGGPRRRV